MFRSCSLVVGSIFASRSCAEFSVRKRSVTTEFYCKLISAYSKDRDIPLVVLHVDQSEESSDFALAKCLANCDPRPYDSGYPLTMFFCLQEKKAPSEEALQSLLNLRHSLNACDGLGDLAKNRNTVEHSVEHLGIASNGDVPWPFCLPGADPNHRYEEQFKLHGPVFAVCSSGMLHWGYKQTSINFVEIKHVLYI